MEKSCVSLLKISKFWFPEQLWKVYTKAKSLFSPINQLTLLLNHVCITRALPCLACTLSVWMVRSKEIIIILIPVHVVELCRCEVKRLIINGSISFKNVFPADFKETDFKSCRNQPGVRNTELTSQMLVSLNISPAPLLSEHIQPFDV